MNQSVPSSAHHDRWTFRLEDWPDAAGGCTQRGPHDPRDTQSGFNLGHTRNANHRHVDQRRRQALRDLGLAGHVLVCADQVHGDHIAVARHADLARLRGRWGYPYYPQTDALITAERGLALLLFYADCCPVFLYSPEVPAIGLAHCGWRGAVANLAGKTVAALQREFGAPPQTLRAVVGPCIGVECYEVGPEVISATEAVGGDAALRQYGRRTHLDLLALNSLLLARAGLLESSVRVIDHCTRCGAVPLYSWRREGRRTGRLGAFLGLR